MMDYQFCANAAVELERLKSSYEQLQESSSAERHDLQDRIYKLRNDLQDSKDRMAAEQIVLGASTLHARIYCCCIPTHD